MAFEISVDFILVGIDLDPNVITDKLGIIPTKTFLAGDLIQPKASPRWKRNGWMLESKIEKSAELEEHINSVFEQLQPGWYKLKDICQIYEALIDCVVYTYEYIPAICFDKDIVQKAAELNAKIDVDIIISSTNLL